MERAFHNWIKNRIQCGSRVKVGIGDDAAVLQDSDLRWVVSTDMIASGVHFDDQEHALHLIGRKLMAVNLSDLAAMGATPVAALLDFLLPSQFSIEEAQQIFIGSQKIAEEFGVDIVGGDTNRWEGKLVLSATVLGLEGVTADGPVAWKMSGAQVGDQIIVSGSFGGSILGHHLTFTPRVKLASQLIRDFEINAATDVSDSLSLDLAAIASSSGVGLELDVDQIPISEAAQTLSAQDGLSSLEHALIDGEDFELIFMAAQGESERLVNEYSGGVRLSVVGRVIAEAGLWLCYADGRRERFEAKGYSH